MNHLKSHLIPFFAEFDCLNFNEIDNLTKPKVPVMAAIAMRKKVKRIGHFLPCFCLQSPQIFLFVSRGADSVKLPRRKKIPTKAAAISFKTSPMKLT